MTDCVVVFAWPFKENIDHYCISVTHWWHGYSGDQVCTCSLFSPQKFY